MDRVPVSETVDAGPIPAEGTLQSYNKNMPYNSETGEGMRPYDEIIPDMGSRTISLLEREARLGLCDSITILASIMSNTSRSVVMLPGGLDMKPDEKTFKLAKEMGTSAVMVRYPNKPAFSLRREVAEALDYLDSVNIREIDLMTGSYGGIPALMLMYEALGESNTGIRIRSFFAAKAALQPSDLQPWISRGAQVSFGFETKAKISLRVARGIRARMNAPDNVFPDRQVLEKIAEVPTMFIVPPGGGDALVKITGSYDQYFPKAQVIEDSEARSGFLGSVTGGHMSPRTEQGLRILQKAFLENPGNRLENLPSGYKRIK